MSWFLIKLLRVYQLVVSPALHTLLPAASGCRFTPTCSQYAMDALRAHGAWRGLWLAARRLARCHPWGGHGYDPAPAVGESRVTHYASRITHHESPTNG
ncbi:MAG: membrane protein insertion efficiency factor YidD [Verrucomicrobia bacterium]|nr:membrane protein insertion efficiency factor YidD [Verrucomicrobiota bacterium]